MKATFEKTTKVGRTTAVVVVAVLAALLLALTASAEAAETEKKKGKRVDKIAFSSNRTSGQGVDNPTGDNEIFVMNPDGTGLKQLTFNTINDEGPTLSPDGKKIAYTSNQVQPSNPEGDFEVYLMNAADGSDQQNLSNTGIINDFSPDFAPDGEKIAYTSVGKQPSNLEGDGEIYLMEADGSLQQNLTNTAGGPFDSDPDFSPNGKKIVYHSSGAQDSNPEGDFEIYLMKADGSGQRNLSNKDRSDLEPVFSPDGKKIAYRNFGAKSSNPEGDDEIYLMEADGSKQRNLTDTASGITDSVPDFSPDGKIAYQSFGKQSSNREGDTEVYLMEADGSKKRNLTDTASGITDSEPDFGKVKKKK